jgi:hypothetical protein
MKVKDLLEILNIAISLDEKVLELNIYKNDDRMNGDLDRHSINDVKVYDDGIDIY